MTSSPQTTGALCSAEDAAELALQVAALAKAGLPLEAGLRAAAAEMPSRRLRKALEYVAARLQAGESLAEVLAGSGRRLPLREQAVVLAGVRSGHLDEVLEQFVHQQHQARSLRRQILSVLAYPALLMVMSLGLLLFFARLMAESLLPILEDFGTDIPYQTQLLASISQLGLFFPAVCLLTLAVIIAVCFKIGGGIAAQVPLIGPLWSFCSLADFCGLMSLLVARQAPLPDAFDLASRSNRDRGIAAAARSAGEQIAAGIPPTAALAGQRAIPSTLRELVAWGGGLPALAESLRIAGEFYQQRARRQVSVIRTVAAPLAFVIATATIGVVIFTALLPLLRIMETLT